MAKKKRSPAQSKTTVRTKNKIDQSQTETTVIDTNDLLNVKQAHEKGLSIPAVKHNWEETKK